jgi:hypothetical protein
MTIFSTSNTFVFDPDLVGANFAGEPDYWAPCEAVLGQPTEFEEVNIPGLRGVSNSKLNRRHHTAQKTRRGRLRHCSDTTFWWPGSGKGFSSKHFNGGGDKPRFKK